MFSRDFQLSRNRKLPFSRPARRGRYAKNLVQRDRFWQEKALNKKSLYRIPLCKTMSVESSSEALGKQIRETQTRETQTSKTISTDNHKAATERGAVEKMATSKTTIERSLSWQVAPDLFTSFRYAWAGISYAFKTQRNFRVHTGVGTLAMVLCWILKVSNLEIAIICLTIGAVLVMEILNTALESLVDLTVGQTYHQLAKIAKDCAAGAVLMAAIVALIIAALIFAPPLWASLQHYLHLASAAHS